MGGFEVNYNWLKRRLYWFCLVVDDLLKIVNEILGRGEKKIVLCKLIKWFIFGFRFYCLFGFVYWWCLRCENRMIFDRVFVVKSYIFCLWCM